MPVILNKNRSSEQSHSSIFPKVCRYCLPSMLIATFIPFILVLISLLLGSLNAIPAAEFISHFLAFPIAVMTPLFFTVKNIYALKGAFPRKTGSHKVVLSVFFCSCICTIILILLFDLSCALYGAFPLNFKGAAYMRDMFASSIGAMFILHVTIFIFYTFISLMAITSYFIGDRSKVRFKFTLTCIVFLAIYVVFLILLILCYFASTFIDITALENIQISQSFFNSSMLCAFVTFDILALITSPALYFTNLRSLKKENKK